MRQQANDVHGSEISAGVIAAKPRWAISRSALAAFALGAATVAGFAPLYFFPLPIAAFAMLLYLWTRTAHARAAGRLGWWFGLGYFGAGVSWVYVSLHDFGAMPAPLAAVATLLFCAYLALFPGLVGYAYRVVRGPLWIRAAVFAPALWTFAEWVRGWLFTGFPWLGIGYSQVPLSPLSGYAPLLGIYGVTLIALVSAGIVFVAVRHAFGTSTQRDTTPRRAARAVALLVLLVPVWLGGFLLREVRWTQPVGEPVSVTLLQGNIPQEIKWTDEGLRTTFITYRNLALASTARLIVLPETALPLFLRDVPADYLASLADHARRNGGDVLIGVPEREPGGDYYNSVLSMGASPIQAYRKSRLVPFGEFIPLRPILGWIVSVLAIPLQDFTPGTREPRPLRVAGQRVAVNVCYEDAFGEEIIRQLPEATLLVNVSNVAWFGRSIAPMQHLQISQARAIETGRYMLRATNTGMTAVVGERGQVVKVAPQFSTAALTANVQGYTGATPYVRWGNNLVLALCGALIAVALWWPTRAQV
ncbi:MAG: apolipoprotein N-acyltransferase [Burkholderiales bacterium]